MRGIVPDAILDRTDKIGFATPERRWLTMLDAWVRRTLGSDSAEEVPFLNLRVARQEWDSVREGSRAFDSRIWRWVNLILWTEELSVTYK